MAQIGSSAERRAQAASARINGTARLIESGQARTGMMTMFRKLVVALVATLTMASAIAPEANAWSFTDRLRGSRATDASAPLAFQLFCLKHPSECRRSK